MDEDTKPTSNDSDRDARGRFRPGNSASKGLKNPAVARANQLRAAVASEMTESKIRMVVNSLFKRAIAGNPHAIEIFLRYAIGPAVNFDLIERIRAVERAAGVDSGEDFDEPLKSPLLDFEFDRDGRPMPVRGKPRPIRELVNAEDDPDE